MYDEFEITFMDSSTTLMWINLEDDVMDAIIAMAESLNLSADDIRSFRMTGKRSDSPDYGVEEKDDKE